MASAAAASAPAMLATPRASRAVVQPLVGYITRHNGTLWDWASVAAGLGDINWLRLNPAHIMPYGINRNEAGGWVWQVDHLVGGVLVCVCVLSVRTWAGGIAQYRAG